MIKGLNYMQLLDKVRVKCHKTMSQTMAMKQGHSQGHSNASVTKTVVIKNNNDRKDFAPDFYDHDQTTSVSRKQVSAISPPVVSKPDRRKLCTMFAKKCRCSHSTLALAGVAGY